MRLYDCYWADFIGVCSEMCLVPPKNWHVFFKQLPEMKEVSAQGYHHKSFSLEKKIINAKFRIKAFDPDWYSQLKNSNICTLWLKMDSFKLHQGRKTFTNMFLTWSWSLSQDKKRQSNSKSHYFSSNTPVLYKNEHQQCGQAGINCGQRSVRNYAVW